MSRLLLDRRKILRAGLTAAAALPLAGCDAFDMLTDRANPLREWMISINGLTYRAQRALQSAGQLAPEFAPSDIRQAQRPNGSTDPDTPDYLALRERNFADYALEVGGLVERPTRFSLESLRNMPSRSQITRHDCVEGWSSIGQWKGAKLSAILEMAGLKPEAKFIVFHCADSWDAEAPDGDYYYESVDLVDAYHPQTILAYEMNGAPLPIAHGAPLRLRAERHLGYKQAKYVMRLEAVASFDHIGKGKGGFWEDRGYEWYAGI